MKGWRDRKCLHTRRSPVTSSRTLGNKYMLRREFASREIELRIHNLRESSGLPTQQNYRLKFLYVIFPQVEIMKQWKLLGGTVSFGITIYVNNDTQRVYTGQDAHMFPPKIHITNASLFLPSAIVHSIYRPLTCVQFLRTSQMAGRTSMLATAICAANASPPTYCQRNNEVGGLLMKSVHAP